MVNQAINFLISLWTYILEILQDKEWMLVIFTAILALFTYRLWRDSRILQRAYIAVEPRGIHMLLNGSDLIGHVGIKNAGKLPARNVSWFIGIKHSGSGEEPGDFFPLERDKGSIVIAPDTIATRGSGPGVQVQTLNEFCGVPSGKARTSQRETFLYVWGVVNYHDGFKKKRMTKFCHRYNWINRGRNLPPAQAYEIDAEFARHHEHGNDAT
jgi:hypothetical protein